MKAHQRYNLEGRYVQLGVLASPTQLADIERKLRVDEEIIRFLTTKQQTKPTLPPPPPTHNNTNTTTTTATTAQSSLPLDPHTLAQLQHNTAIDVYAARALLDSGLLSEDDILALDRHSYDADWEQRTRPVRDARERAAQEAAEAAATEQAEEDSRVAAVVEAEYNNAKLYLDERRKQVAIANAARLEWRHTESVRAEQRKAVIEQRLLDKWISKEMKARRESRKRRGEQRWTVEEEAAVETSVRSMFQRRRESRRERMKQMS